MEIEDKIIKKKNGTYELECPKCHRVLSHITVGGLKYSYKIHKCVEKK